MMFGSTPLHGDSPLRSRRVGGRRLSPVKWVQRLNLCDLSAIQSPTDPSRTVIVLNACDDALHPNAIYRLKIENDRDLRTALSCTFSKPLWQGAGSRPVQAIGKMIVIDAGFQSSGRG